MFGSQALRLLRENWPSPTMLAQELYAIFQDANPTTSGPLTITNPNKAGPGLAVKNSGGSADVMSFTGGTGGTSTMSFGPDGGLVFTTPSFSTADKPGGPTTNIKNSGGAVPGQVLSGGPGAAYSVQVFPNGLAAASKTVAAVQLQIDAGETIQPGTFALFSLAGPTYYFQAPVWGAP